MLNFKRIQDVSSEAHRRWMNKKKERSRQYVCMYELKRQFNNNARIADGKKFQYLNYNF